MTDTGGAKATAEHWENTWSSPPRFRLPSRLWIGVADMQAILRAHVKPGMSVLEIGCAPGKTLAWVDKRLRARVAGLDYSERGLAYTRELFRRLAIDGDLRREDVFATTFPPGSFDVVYSCGVIEHFEDPREIVRRHVMLAKPGGTALITIPNYGGLYGRLRKRFDPENLEIHNLAIMNPRALAALTPRDLVDTSRAYPAGRLSPWLIRLERRWPRRLARATRFFLNGVALLQPVRIRRLCPMLVLEIRRTEESPC